MNKFNLQPSLSKDLFKLMKGLDFSKVRLQDARDSEEERDESGEDGSDAGEMREEEKDISSSKAAKESKQQSVRKEEKKPDIVIPKVGPNSRLVSLS